jgi:aspartate aminotransferase
MTPRVSNLAGRIQASATLAAAAKARQMRAQGIRVYDFSLGEPDFATPEHVRRAAAEAMDRGLTKYTPVNGILELRTALAQVYQRLYGLVVQPEQVVVTSGAKHAICNAVATVVNPGDEVILPAPYWTSYRDIIEMNGGVPVIITTTSENNFKMMPAQLRAALTPRSKALILNTPCNPTGAVYRPEELQAIGDVVLDSSLAVVSDEIYEFLTYGNAKATNFASLHPGLTERTITISGASKTYAMTGWRMGWAVGPLPLIKAMGNVESQQTGCPNSVSQYAVLAAITGDQSCVEKMRQEFAARADLAAQLASRIPGITFPRPEGAFYLFFNVSAYFNRPLPIGRSVKNSMEFCQAALESKQVNLVPGSEFGAEGFVRMSYATSRSEIEAGFEQISAMLLG